jgi:TolB protein
VTVTAPPRPPGPSDPVDREELEALVEALIEEARRRAQRRRRRNGAVVTLLALVGVALLAVLGRSAQSQTASPALAAPSSLSAATGGSKIAFIREPRGGYAGVLWVMNPDGSGQRELGPAFPELDWSPDGQKIAFTTWGDRRGPGGTNPTDIYVTNADGSGRERLTTHSSFETSPAWSPDGRTIAFVSGREGAGIYVMSADGTDQRLLTRAGVAGYLGRLAWSPDGQKIAFTVALSSGPDGNLEIYVVNADGSGQRRLTRSTARESHPVWSPDGRRIVFERNWQLWVMNADGSGRQRLTRTGAHNFNAAWSPDGQRIVFERDRQQRDPCGGCLGSWGFEVYVMNADGSGQQRLTRGGSQPRWSPDGRKIAFVSNDGTADIWVMNADGSGQRNLTRTPGADRRESEPVWSPPQR